MTRATTAAALIWFFSAWAIDCRVSPATVVRLKLTPLTAICQTEPTVTAPLSWNCVKLANGLPTMSADLS